MNSANAVTRQELLKLKKRLAEVRAGYKLLEQKRDSLIKTFMELKEAFLERKEKLYEELKLVIGTLEETIKLNPVNLIEFISSKAGDAPEIESKNQSIMGVKTTIFLLKKLSPREIEEKFCPPTFFESVMRFSSLIPELIAVSSLEDALIKMASAIEKTRRRVNILKDITIPNMEKQIKYISLKLADQEREGFVFNLTFKQKRLKTTQ